MKGFIGTWKNLKIKSADKVSLHQWLQGVFFTLYAWNAGPVNGTSVARSVLAIGRYLPFPVDLSPSRLRESNSEGQQSFDHSDAASPLLFRQRELFNILVSERRLRHRELRNKGKFMREFDTGDLVILSKQVKSKIKYGIYQKLLFKTKELYRVLENATPRSYWLERLTFCEGIGRLGKKVKK